MRVTADGSLALTPHPTALGAALTNRYITTDFSEALLEFVTPAEATTWEALQSLCAIHRFTYENLGDEMLWVASMPCPVPSDGEIPLARYGDSNVGRMKTAYRRGLGHRYGRHMQTIAGVHFNYSLPDEFWSHYRQECGDDGDTGDFRSTHYLGLVRNFRRMGWLMLYLFGASPALCKSFLRAAGIDMPAFDGSTFAEPFGTSLRMSDLGYSNQAQAAISISLNELDEYIRDLSAAIHTPAPAFEAIGIEVDGEYRQLSTSVLQIENEYYSPIRPKRVARSGERPTAALRRGGIEYVEVRSLDINVFDPCGISQNTMRFVEAFLVYCLLSPSPPLDDAALEEARWNQEQTARRGRDPALELRRGGGEVSLRAWAGDIVGDVAGVAELLDRADGGNSYRAAVAEMRELVTLPEATPSARILENLSTNGDTWFEFVMQQSRQHRDYFAGPMLASSTVDADLAAEAQASIERQAAIEAADAESFEDYLARYFAAD